MQMFRFHVSSHSSSYAILNRDTMYRMFSVTSRCGHTLCAECAVTDWVQVVTRPPRHSNRLDLPTTRCPICRADHPEVIIVADIDGFVERSKDCVPFHRNIQQDTLIDNLLDVLKTSLNRLSEIVPDDSTVQAWKETYEGEVHVEERL